LASIKFELILTGFANKQTILKQLPHN